MAYIGQMPSAAALTADQINDGIITTSKIGDNQVTAAKIGGETGTGNVVFSTSPVFTTPSLGIPTAADLTNAINLPLLTGSTGVLSIARGGTGASTAANAIIALGGASTGKSIAMAMIFGA